MLKVDISLRICLDYYVFRPPFINGRPQDSVSVFWKKSHYSLFLEPFFPCFFHLHHFQKGVTRGKPGETGGD